jgi:WD40 repeat protein
METRSKKRRREEEDGKVGSRACSTSSSSSSNADITAGSELIRAEQPTIPLVPDVYVVEDFSCNLLVCDATNSKTIIKVDPPFHFVDSAAVSIVSELLVVYTAREDTIRVWDLRTGELSYSITAWCGGCSGNSPRLLLSAAGTKFLFQSCGDFGNYNAQTGTILWKSSGTEEEEQVAVNYAIVDGREQVIALNNMGKFRIWDAEMEQELFTFQGFTPADEDGIIDTSSRLAVGTHRPLCCGRCDGTLYVWNHASGTILFQSAEYGIDVTDFMLGPNDDTVLAVIWCRDGDCVLAWGIASATRLRVFHLGDFHVRHLMGCCLGRDAVYVIAGGFCNEMMYELDMSTGSKTVYSTVYYSIVNYSVRQNAPVILL